MIKKIQKNVKGITLIALVVTIIVLLILAGVAISLTIGQNGIISRAQEATVIHENASVYEQLQLVVLDYQMSDVENSTETEILSKLKEDGYVNEDNTLNIERLMGRRLNTGRGSLENGDVYVLEQREETASSVTSDVGGDLKYYLIYYGENNSTSTNLGLAFEGKEELEPTDPSLFVVSEYGAISLKDFDKYYSGNTEWTIENLVIPREVNGREVKFITSTLVKGHNIPSIQKNLKSVIIPDTVLAIGYQAFEKCSSLETVKLSNNIKEIEIEAFSGCKSLTEIEIPASITEIGANAFKDCDNLTKIYINRPLEEIEGHENAPWGADNAEIIYKPYEDFKESYLKDKSQSELEDIFALGIGESFETTFDKVLEEVGVTRTELEQEAAQIGLSYEDYLREVISIEADSWVQIEFLFENSEFSNKSNDELKAYILEGTGYTTFDQALQEITSDASMNEEKYVEMLKGVALRNERNFLKVLVVTKANA